MTKDMFDLSPITQGMGHMPPPMAKYIFDLVFQDENISENSSIEELLPKVTFFREERGVFILRTISTFDTTAAKFIHNIIYSEIDAVTDLEVESFCSLPFRFYELDIKKYLVTEAVIFVKDQEKLETCHNLVKSLQKQMRLGLRSNFYARMVMEMKISSLHGKTSYVQERIVSYIHHFPKIFDYDLIPFMNEFMTGASETFTKDRSVRDLSKIIVTLYFCKKINGPVKSRTVGARQIYVKARHIYAEELFGRKKVVGIMIFLPYLSDNERLGEEHILKACRRFILKTISVEGSFMKLSNDGERSGLFYLEIEKKEGVITPPEKKKLEEGLSKCLEEHIQKFARKIFMPQNTEEVMKYTVALSKELRSKQDYPQVAVLFDSQLNDILIFTAIIVRVKSEEKGAAFKVFESGIQNKYTCSIKHLRSLGDFKEGLEVTYKMKIRFYMREDYSVDIYRARAMVIKDLQDRFGIIRDYNGGMLEKQEGLLSESQTALRKKGIKNMALIENFFYSMQPSEMRAVLDTDDFVNFFLFFYGLFTYQTTNDSRLEVKDGEVNFIIRVKSEKKKEAFINEVREWEARAGELVYFSLRIQEKFYLGVRFKYPDEAAKTEFLDKMSICLKL